MCRRIWFKKMCQRLTTYLASAGICMAYVEFSADGVMTVTDTWPTRLPPFPTTPTNRKEFHHYEHLGHTVLGGLIDHQEPSNPLKHKKGSMLGRRKDMDASRQLGLTRCVRR